MLNVYVTSISNEILFKRYFMMEFFSQLILFNYLICTYLNDLKFNFSFKVVKSDEDATQHGKIV
jgi:hypothetical protein